MEPSKLTVAAYLARWLADYAKPRTSGKTYERYAQIVESHLKPGLGHHLLRKLQPLHIQDLYAHSLAAGRKGGKSGLSPRTVLHIHRVVHLALRQAVRWQLLARNPAESVEPPRPHDQEMRVLNEAEMGQLLRSAEHTRLYEAILLALTTGMRRGEIAALTWSDVDLKSGAVTVTKSLEQTRAGLTVKTPKTAKGRRTIPLPAMAAIALRRHKSRQAEQRLRLGPAYQDRGLVCAAPDGSYWPPDLLSKAFRALIVRTGLRLVRFHDLRHTHATQLLRQSVHPKVVAERLGHSTITITLDTYSHVLPGLQEEAAQRLDQVLRRAVRERKGTRS